MGLLLLLLPELLDTPPAVAIFSTFATRFLTPGYLT